MEPYAEEDDDLDLEAAVTDIAASIPEHPNYLPRRVLNGPFVALARVGDTLFRGTSNQSFALAVEDLDARVIKWRIREGKTKDTPAPPAGTPEAPLSGTEGQ